MTHDEITDLLGAYALDAVDPDERDAVEAHLASCARCRAEVAEHREVAGHLAYDGGDAPEGLWDRIAGSLGDAPARPASPLRPVPSVAAGRRWRPSRLGVALTAAAALLVAVLGIEVRDREDRIEELRAALADPVRPAFEAALADPDSQRFELISGDGGLVVEGAVTEEGVGFLRAESLPDLGEDRTYQLWGAAGDELVSLGVLGDRPTYLSFRGRGYRAFAITEEAAPGVVTSRQTPVVAGSVLA